MKKVCFILQLLLFSSGFVFGQIKISGDNLSFKNDERYFNSLNLVPIQNSQTVQLIKDLNLNINESLKAIYIKNDGFKKEIDYFGSNENIFENGVGKIKINSGSTSFGRDIIESYLNIILNK